MVQIIDKNFKMIHISGPFFDLSQLVKINAGKDNEREEMKIIAYGLPIDACLKHIACSKIPDGDYTIKEYITAYHKVIKELELELSLEIIDDKLK